MVVTWVTSLIFLPSTYAIMITVSCLTPIYLANYLSWAPAKSANVALSTGKTHISFTVTQEVEGAPAFGRL